MLDARSIDYIDLAMYICMNLYILFALRRKCTSLLFVYRSAVIVLHKLLRSVMCMHSIMCMRMRFD